MTTAAPELPGAEHRFVRAGDVRLHLVECGKGPLVVLLHGFPETWWSWRHQLPALAAAGFRAVALDLRGHGLSDRPRGVGAYSVSALAGDVEGILDALGAARAAAIVGHDWGGVVAYRFAARRRHRVDRLVILNSPHPAALAGGLLRNAQALRSAYMLAFMVPALPERAFAARDGALLRAVLRAFRSTPVDDRELEPYVAAARASEWLRGGLDVYRAMGLGLLRRAPLLRRVGRAARAASRPRRIDVPVLVVWGEDDPVLAPHLARPPAALVPHVRVERIAGASHDVMLDAPERVNRLVVEWLARSLAR